MPLPLRRPSAALVLAGALLLGALPAHAARATSGTLEPAFRVVSTDAALVPRFAGPAEPLATLAAAAEQPSDARTAAARSTWRVSYDAGFRANATARAEFQRAVDTWAAVIGSRVPITVDARFRSLAPGVLGQAGPGGFVEEVPDRRFQAGERILPVALGNALAGRDLIPPTAEDGGFDVQAEFPSNNPDIYYGPGPVPDDAYDFYSTALHEIGHGLGFGSGYRYSSGGTGTYVVPDYLLPYDRFLTVGTSGTTDLYRMARGSTRLGSALVGGDLYWRGTKGTSAAGGRRPKMQATSPFRQGSSLSHLDERTYPAGTANALMTPAGAPGEQNRAVGPIALGILGDLGWSVPATAGPAPSSPAATPSPTRPAPGTAPSPTTPASPFASGPGSRF
ncbi:MAG: hypothetical protein JWO60_2591, partial [Frankiales bacterium]|nr:hypothetical protein [Frankiales bacterium]